jgi:hypothetical protein
MIDKIIKLIDEYSKTYEGTIVKLTCQLIKLDSKEKVEHIDSYLRRQNEVHVRKHMIPSLLLIIREMSYENEIQEIMNQINKFKK